MLILSRADIARTLDTRSSIDAMIQAHKLLSTGDVVMPNRLVFTTTDQNRVNAMPAFVRSLSALGMKANTNFPTNADLNLPTIHGLIILWNADTGVPLAVMDGSLITAIRTAAASAAATKLLARPDSDVLAIIGCGVQGQSHLDALPMVRAIRSVRLFDRDPSRAEHLARRAESMYQIPAVVCHSIVDAVSNANIVVTTTSSRLPILAWDWISPGTHINAIGSHSPSTRELPTEVMVRSRVIVDSRDAVLAECGDVLIPIAEGVMDPIALATTLVELGEVATGAKPGRTAASEVTVYKSVGIAVQDVVSAHVVYERACQLGLGISVEL